MKTIIECINGLSSNLPCKNHGKDLFYYFMERKMEEYIEEIKSIEESELIPLLSDTSLWNDEPTKKSFVSLCEALTKKCLRVLSLCYEGRRCAAGIELEKLLLDPVYTESKLADPYYHCLNMTKLTERVEKLYRVVSFLPSEDVNYYHIPFEKRYLVRGERFSLAGCPCLYLSDREETAIKEVGRSKKGRKRYLGVFRLEDKYDINIIACVDLTIPTPKEIMAFEEIDKFNYLLKYPLMLLCLTETVEHKVCGKNVESIFYEEYMFPQLLFQTIFYESEELKLYHKGIAFSSTKGKGINFAFPAHDLDDQPQKCGYDKDLKELIVFVEGKILQKKRWISLCRK